MLQPITSLVATLSLVKPQYCPRLIGKLVSPSPYADSTTATNTGREENTRSKHTQFRHVKSNIDILTANATERHSAPPTLSSYRITGESQGGTESRIGSKGGRDDISATAHSDSQSYAIACGTDLMPVSMMPVTTPGDGGPTRNGPANRHREFNRDREFVACHASDPELYVSLQLLFHHEHHSRGKTHSQVNHGYCKAGYYLSLSWHC